MSYIVLRRRITSASGGPTEFTPILKTNPKPKTAGVLPAGNNWDRRKTGEAVYRGGAGLLRKKRPKARLEKNDWAGRGRSRVRNPCYEERTLFSSEGRGCKSLDEAGQPVGKGPVVRASLTEEGSRVPRAGRHEARSEDACYGRVGLERSRQVGVLAGGDEEERRVQMTRSTMRHAADEV